MQKTAALNSYLFYFICALGFGFGCGISVLYITIQGAEQFGTNLRASVHFNNQ